MATHSDKSNMKANPVTSNVLFDKRNYILMAIGMLVLTLGYYLMAGGKSPNPKEFHPEEVYSKIRITVAPILIILGFGIEIAAIMLKPKN